MAKVYLDPDGDTCVFLSDGRSFYTHMGGEPWPLGTIHLRGAPAGPMASAFMYEISDERAMEMRESGLSATERYQGRQSQPEVLDPLYCAVFAQVWAARVAEGESDDGAATEADALARRAVEAHARIGGRK